MELIRDTLSICPECLRVINARVIKEGSVYLEKECEVHGRFRIKHNWDKKEIYQRIIGLISQEKSQADGLVLNLTSNCNMNCPFCYAHANEMLSKDLEIHKIEELLKKYNGRMVYLSGGEPTVSKNLISIIKMIKKKGYQVGLFSNGKKLRDRSYVRDLKQAGLDFVILQFDTFNDENYIFLRGEPLQMIKLKAIENLRMYKIPIYLFVMLLKEKNMKEIGNLINFISKRKDYIKIINFNPVWETGRRAPHGEITTSMILQEVESQTGIKTEEFLDCTEFAYYFFFILNRLRGRNYVVQPRCELRCYIISGSDKIIPLTRIIEIKKINFMLKKMVYKGTSRAKILSSFMLYLPFFYLLFWKKFLCNKNFRRLFKNFIINSLTNIFKLSLFHISPFTSIIIGTFQTAENLDFDMLKDCNLYSDFFPESNVIFSACVRQILFNAVFSNKRVNINELVKFYQEKVIFK